MYSDVEQILSRKYLQAVKDDYYVLSKPSMGTNWYLSISKIDSNAA